MAEILENPKGGRRHIRLTPADVASVVATLQQQFKNAAPPSYSDLQQWMRQQPMYLPEDIR